MCNSNVYVIFLLSIGTPAFDFHVICESIIISFEAFLYSWQHFHFACSPCADIAI